MFEDIYQPIPPSEGCYHPRSLWICHMKMSPTSHHQAPCGRQASLKIDQTPSFFVLLRDMSQRLQASSVCFEYRTLKNKKPPDAATCKQSSPDPPAPEKVRSPEGRLRRSPSARCSWSLPTRNATRTTPTRYTSCDNPQAIHAKCGIIKLQKNNY